MAARVKLLPAVTQGSASKEVLIPRLNHDEVLVGIHVTTLSHHDLSVRQNPYSAIEFGVPLPGDGYGTVIATKNMLLRAGTAREWSW